MSKSEIEPAFSAASEAAIAEPRAASDDEHFAPAQGSFVPQARVNPRRRTYRRSACVGPLQDRIAGAAIFTAVVTRRAGAGRDLVRIVIRAPRML